MTVESLIAFDFGLKYIGVAVGETFTGSSKPLECIKTHPTMPWGKMDEVFKCWGPDLIIIGNPLTLEGKEQPISVHVKKFSQQLIHRYKLPVTWIDERFSTKEAKDRLFAEHGYQGLKKESIDALSAEIILRQWLDEQKSI